MTGPDHPETSADRSPSLPPASRLAVEGAQGGGGRRRRGGRRRQPKRGRNPARVSVLALVVFVLLFAGVGGYIFLQSYVSPPDYSGRGTTPVVIEVDEGASVSEIGATLERSGVVKSSRAFVRTAGQESRARSIQPGHYQLRRRMASSAALDALLDPSSRVQARVVVPEGTRMSEIFRAIAKKTDISTKALEEVAKNPSELGMPSYAKSPKGYLFPATYTVRPEDTAPQLLRRTVNRFQETARNIDLVEQARQRGITVHEAVTIASLVQGEARDPEAFRKVAAVVYNRLDKDMKLQFDATVNYATGKDTLHVSKKDTQVDSPYNTYKHKGLPPGPINSPGKKALLAALQPAKGDWLYFVATNPKKGVTKFTDNYEEFQRFKRQFERNTNSG